MGVDMPEDDVAHALMVVIHAGFDVMLPGKVDELRALAAVAERRRELPDRDWSRAN